MRERTLSELFDVYSANIISAPMIRTLEEDLGISAESMIKLGVGYSPCDGAFVYPERTSKGNIVGIIRRYADGSKYAIAGSRRSLIYEVNPDYVPGKTKYESGRHNWTRVATAGVKCPVCGRPDWCLVSSDNPYDPAAVICSRTEKGSRKKIEDSGYLHVRKAAGEVGPCGPLKSSDLPVIVCEGYTDTATAIDLGFIAVGRASAETCLRDLPDMVRGREVIIVGDHDKTDEKAGQRGMESAFATLRPVCPSVTKVLPPEPYKDLRQWKNQLSLTQESFLEHVREFGDSEGDLNIFEDASPSTIAKAWLEQEHTLDGLPTIRSYYGQWTRYVDGRYINVDQESFRGNLYRFLDNKLVPIPSQSGDTKIVPYYADRKKVSDIIDALSAWCPVYTDSPSWIVDVGLPDPKDLISFKNGLLDIPAYMNGEIVLYPPTPALFSFNMLPYDFDPDAESEVWKGFLDSIFDDEDQKDLLGEWFGYNCVPDMSMEKLMFMLGPPRSGKGTIVNAMAGMLGDDQCASMSFQDLNDTYGYSPMMGKLAVFFPDAKAQNRNKLGNAFERILHVVGEDPVGIRRMYLKFLPQVNLKCRFTMAMNDIPDLPDDSNALGPRLNMLDFSKSFVGREDFTLKGRIQQDARAGKLVNFALRGLKRLRERGEFTTPVSSQRAISRTTEVTSPIKSFIKDFCVLAPPGSDNSFGESVDVLYEAWTGWCNENNLKPSIKIHFSRWLQQSCPRSDVIRVSHEGQRHRFMTGVKLAQWVKTRYGM